MPFDLYIRTGLGNTSVAKDLPEDQRECIEVALVRFRDGYDLDGTFEVQTEKDSYAVRWCDIRDIWIEETA